MSGVPPALPAPPTVARLDPSQVTPALLDALRTGVVAARADVGVLALTGPGAVSCFQGLLTNDIEKPGDGAFIYGALLTPKGMIVVDGWAARHGTTVSYTVPADGRDRALAIFTRSVPPRLARITDRTPEVTVCRLAGVRALAVAETAGLPLPPGPGRTIEGVFEDTACAVARATEQAPFAVQVTIATTHAAALTDRLVAAGALGAEPVALEYARILEGWPRIGVEVDEKTIPQEVRFDEVGGVSYTKGCYTGQETVSRLHFRGHPNRYLRGLLFDAEPPAPPAEGWSTVTHLDREVGRVTSVAWVPSGRGSGGGGGGGRWVGLAVIRREVGPGTMVRAAGRDARVVDLPFTLPHIESA